MNLHKLIGIHAVQAAIDYSPQKVSQIWIDPQRQDARLKELLSKLNSLGIKPEVADKKKLDRFADGKNHQGIVAEVELPSVHSEEELKYKIQNLTEMAFFLVLDHIQDPHNLGACLRTADAAGLHGVIITKDNAIGITPTVCKIASGAAETVPVYQVTNLARTLRWMKQQNIWIIGSTGVAKQTIYMTDLNLPIALVMGAEGMGMRHLTQQQCDLLVKIPMRGQVESLNVSVAAAVMIYEVLRQKGE
jgi:23S rRNA (guanosine2251-2'-O)-methyltransferase